LHHLPFGAFEELDIGAEHEIGRDADHIVEAFEVFSKPSGPTSCTPCCALAQRAISAIIAARGSGSWRCISLVQIVPA
jgi:hypothetical protein